MTVVSQGELALVFNLKAGRNTLEECWMEGFHEANLDLAEENNPYAQGSREAAFWSEGWWAGFYAEEPLFPEYAVGVPVEKERVVVERLREEGEIEAPSYDSIKRFLFALSATAGACFIATAMLT